MRLVDGICGSIVPIPHVHHSAREIADYERKHKGQYQGKWQIHALLSAEKFHGSMGFPTPIIRTILAACHT